MSTEATIMLAILVGMFGLLIWSPIPTWAITLITGKLIGFPRRLHLACLRALIATLKSGRPGAAGLDVCEEESGNFSQDRMGEVMEDDIFIRRLRFTAGGRNENWLVPPATAIAP